MMKMIMVPKKHNNQKHDRKDDKNEDSFKLQAPDITKNLANIYLCLYIYVCIQVCVYICMYLLLNICHIIMLQ